MPKTTPEVQYLQLFTPPPPSWNSTDLRQPSVFQTVESTTTYGTQQAPVSQDRDK